MSIRYTWWAINISLYGYKMKQQILILLSLIWPDRGMDPRSTTLKDEQASHYSNDTFVTRLTPRVSLVEQELLTLREHPSSPPVFTGVRVSVSSSCSTSDTRGVNLVTNPVINHEWGKEREVFTTRGTPDRNHQLWNIV
jgi:hypothetical protein